MELARPNLRDTIRDEAGMNYFANLVAAARVAPAPLLTPLAMRASALAFAESELAHRVPETIEREDIRFNDIGATWFRPKHVRRTAPLLYLHGGGYVCGSIEASRGLAAQIALAFRAPALAVGYRQAPEHPIPAALVDAHTAHAWLTSQTEAPITLIGDSAGGQLAVAASVMSAKAGLRPVRAAIAISAWFDLAMETPGWRDNRARDFSTLEMGRFFREAYLGGLDPRVASVPDRDIALLAPTLVVMGGAERAIDDADAFVTRARNAGAAIAYQVYDGLPHNFVRYACPISMTALQHMAAWENALA